jgi:hypothetical protein
MKVEAPLHNALLDRGCQHHLMRNAALRGFLARLQRSSRPATDGQSCRANDRSAVKIVHVLRCCRCSWSAVGQRTEILVGKLVTCRVQSERERKC